MGGGSADPPSKELPTVRYGLLTAASGGVQLGRQSREPPAQYDRRIDGNIFGTTWSRLRTARRTTAPPPTALRACLVNFGNATRWGPRMLENRPAFRASTRRRARWGGGALPASCDWEGESGVEWAQFWARSDSEHGCTNRQSGWKCL